MRGSCETAGNGYCLLQCPSVGSSRATALGFSVFVMHLLGDIPSPPLIGKISDATSLEHAFLIVPVAFLIGGAIWTFAGWRGGHHA